jgi:CrcB protein
MRLLLVLVGGGLGSAARYVVAVWAAERIGTSFPWGTLIVNVTGSFVIGLVATLADEAGSISPNTRAFLVAGILGGYTTFSAFSLETWRLLDASEWVRALLNILGSVALSGAAVILGVAAGRALSR